MDCSQNPINYIENFNRQYNPCISHNELDMAKGVLEKIRKQEFNLPTWLDQDCCEDKKQYCAPLE